MTTPATIPVDVIASFLEFTGGQHSLGVERLANELSDFVLANQFPVDVLASLETLGATLHDRAIALSNNEPDEDREPVL
jgi:hypothetical protein